MTSKLGNKFWNSYIFISGDWARMKPNDDNLGHNF